VTSADDVESQGPWVVLRHFDDAMDAEITLNFLRDHGVRVEVRGNSVNSATLNRFITVIDIRLVVPAEDLEHAKEVLTAMTSEATEHPFRGARPPELALDEGADRTLVQRRHRSAALILAILVPIAGGHFYARHTGAAIVLALGIVGSFLVALTLGSPQLLVASAILVALDATFSMRAVRRFNEGRIPDEATQRAWAFGAVVVAWALALAFGSLRGD
jgi:hypothetical protein